MIRRPPRSTPLYSSAASDVYKRQHRDRADVAEQVVTGVVDRRGDRVEVEQCHEALVEQRQLDRLADVSREARLVEQRELELALVVAEDALVDDLAQQAGGDDVEVRVVLD